MIDSFNDGPPLSYACSLLTFSLICIFTIDVYQWARFCNVVKEVLCHICQIHLRITQFDGEGKSSFL